MVVNYLRTVFAWGGFPGLGAKKRPPVHDLEYLTNGLLSI
jgi:hypothetical protein